MSRDDLPEGARRDRGTLQPLLTVAMLAVAIIALIIVVSLYGDPSLR